MILSSRWALRELRGGIKGFRIFLACLALGVAVIAGVESIAASIDAGLAADARALLGGDVELHFVHRTATAEELASLRASGAVSRTAEMRAMVRTQDGGGVSLIELRAIDDAYPLYGAATLEPPRPLDQALALRGGVWGTVAAPELIARLGLKIGDTIRIGDGRFVLRASLTREPDASGGSFALGPHVLIAAEALPATGLVQPGSLIDYSYRVRLGPGHDLDSWIERIRREFPDAGWRIRRPGDAAPTLARLLDRMRLFLTLVGLTSLLVGGVGMANAVRAYLATKYASVAILKGLGAPSRVIFATYLTQILILAALGIAIGLVLGALMPVAALPLMPESWSLPAKLGLYSGALALAAVFGLLTTLVFSLWPIASACETQAVALFRSTIEAPTAPPRRPYRLATALAAGLLAALGILTANDRVFASYFIAGAAAALLVFRLLALLLMAGARHVHPRGATLRLALGNLHRRGAPTPGMVASLGLGLTVLVAIALVEANLGRLIAEDLPDRAPSFFFLDVQPDQKPAFDRLLAAYAHDTDAMPSLRGRITRLNGVPAEQAAVAPDTRWTVQSERGLTYKAALPKGSRIVAGEWWPADYRGPPLVSMDADIARGLGLRLGDRVTVDVLGHDLTARLASTRAIDWGSLGINFVMIFSPGSLDGVPQTYIETARTDPGGEAPLERAVAAAFPTVSAIPVRDVLSQLGEIVAAVAVTLRAIAAIALIAGVLVLAGAVAAGQRRRVYEAVLLKVLGATRGVVTRAFLIEFALLGVATAIIATAIGTLAAYFIVEKLIRTQFPFPPGAAMATALIGAALTLMIGYAGTWRALGARPAPYLANE